jgi:tripartite-type tricarboxylate transporter receptor subunit TctC
MLLRNLVWILVTLCCASAASAQDYPRRPIRLLTAGVGGSADFISRLIAQSLSTSLGQQVVVENRGGIIPQQTVAQSPGDGYTLLIHARATWLAQYLGPVSYDPVRDLTPITWVTSSPSVLVVHPSLPVKSVKDLIALAKAKPGQLNYGSATAGSDNHLTAELFKAMAGVKIQGVMYSGTGQALNDLIAGQMQLMFNGVAGVVPHIKSGRLRALGVTSLKRSALYPELPTIADSGVPGYEAVQILGMFAPGKTPPAIVDRLYHETVRVLERPDIRERFLKAGVEPVGSTPDQFAATIKNDMARMGKVIKDNGIKGES